MLGLVVGALLGLAFAPAAGAETRTAVARRVRQLRDLAEEKVDDIGELIAGEEEGEEGEEEEDGERDAEAAREEMRQRLAEARRRRRAGGSRRAALGSAEEDEPAP